jgi:hypothetical protein
MPFSTRNAVMPRGPASGSVLARLAHGQGADVLAGDQLGQVAALLIVVAVAPDLVDAEVGVGTVAQADRGRGTADLLHGDAVLQIAHAGAAQLLLDRDAEQAEGAQLGPEVARKLV